MRLNVSLFWTIVFSITISGCSAVPKNMPLNDPNLSYDSSQASLMLMSVVLRNETGREISMQLHGVTVQKIDSEAQLPRTYTVTPTDLDLESGRYLVRLPLDEGEYVVRTVSGLAKDGILTFKPFVTPLHLKTTGKTSGIHYLGSIDAVLRPRGDGEFVAGPPRSSGGSVGRVSFSSTVQLADETFDVKVIDDYSIDIERFRSQFRALAPSDIAKNLLPEFDRPAVEALLAKEAADQNKNVISRLLGK